METFPQILINLRVKERRDLKSLPGARQAIQTAEKRLGDRDRLLVRYSGTEPLLRIMVEGDNSQEIERVAQDLAQTLEKLLS
jgi:phosphoglucosamine mutase